MMKLNIFKLLPLALLLIAASIVQQVSALVVGMERLNPLNLPYDYDLTYAPESQKANVVDNGNVDAELFDANDNRYNNEKRSSRIHVLRRGCIPRAGACDNRPNDCCYNSSCRCNLWGNNCRCQRMGLFQKWG